MKRYELISKKKLRKLKGKLKGKLKELRKLKKELRKLKKNQPQVNVLGTPKIRRTLELLEAGRTVYVVPWAYNLKVGKLDISFSYSIKPKGTSCMPVTRTEKGYSINLDFNYFGKKYEF